MKLARLQQNLCWNSIESTAKISYRNIVDDFLIKSAFYTTWNLFDAQHYERRTLQKKWAY